MTITAITGLAMETRVNHMAEGGLSATRQARRVRPTPLAPARVPWPWASAHAVAHQAGPLAQHPVTGVQARAPPPSRRRRAPWGGRPVAPSVTTPALDAASHAARRAGPGRCAPRQRAPPAPWSAPARCCRVQQALAQAPRAAPPPGRRHHRAGPSLVALGLMRATVAATSAPPGRRAAGWRGWPTRSVGHVLRRDGGLQLEARQVDDLDDAPVQRHPLARLHQALRHQAADRRHQRAVTAALAGQFHAASAACRLAWAPASLLDRGVQRGAAR
jgi:hypothetical protein